MFFPRHKILKTAATIHFVFQRYLFQIIFIKNIFQVLCNKWQPFPRGIG